MRKLRVTEVSHCLGPLNTQGESEAPFQHSVFKSQQPFKSQNLDQGLVSGKSFKKAGSDDAGLF